MTARDFAFLLAGAGIVTLVWLVREAVALREADLVTRAARRWSADRLWTALALGYAVWAWLVRTAVTAVVGGVQLVGRAWRWARQDWRLWEPAVVHQGWDDDPADTLHNLVLGLDVPIGPLVDDFTHPSDLEDPTVLGATVYAELADLAPKVDFVIVWTSPLPARPWRRAPGGHRAPELAELTAGTP